MGDTWCGGHGGHTEERENRVSGCNNMGGGDRVPGSWLVITEMSWPVFFRIHVSTGDRRVDR